MSTVVAQNFKDPTTLKTVDAAYITSGLKVWIDFNGNGTVSIRTSLNVSSLVDGGTGLYTINYTSALSAAVSPASGMAGNSTALMSNHGAVTASSFASRVFSDSGTDWDRDYDSLLVAGDLA